MQNVPEAVIENSWYDERAMRSGRWKLILRGFTADPRGHNNALFDVAGAPGEIANLHDRAEYREQHKGQLELMLQKAVNLRDEPAITPAKQEIAALDDPDYQYILY